MCGEKRQRKWSPVQGKQEGFTSTGAIFVCESGGMISREVKVRSLSGHSELASDERALFHRPFLGSQILQKSCWAYSQSEL